MVMDMAANVITNMGMRFRFARPRRRHTV